VFRFTVDLHTHFFYSPVYIQSLADCPRREPPKSMAILFTVCTLRVVKSVNVDRPMLNLKETDMERVAYLDLPAEYDGIRIEVLRALEEICESASLPRDRRHPISKRNSQSTVESTIASA
jgi:hypothetical protein